MGILKKHTAMSLPIQNVSPHGTSGCELRTVCFHITQHFPCETGDILWKSPRCSFPGACSAPARVKLNFFFIGTKISIHLQRVGQVIRISDCLQENIKLQKNPLRILAKTSQELMCKCCIISSQILSMSPLEKIRTGFFYFIFYFLAK